MRVGHTTQDSTLERSICTTYVLQASRRFEYQMLLHIQRWPFAQLALAQPITAPNLHNSGTPYVFTDCHHIIHCLFSNSALALLPSMQAFRRLLSLFKAKEVPSISDADEIYPLFFLDNLSTGRVIVLSEALRFDAVLDPIKLRDALTRLIQQGDWKKLGGRLRTQVKTSTFSS